MTLTIHDVEQRSEEWHALRRGIVTASSVGRLLTATGKPANNDYSRALTASLVAERVTGFTEPTYMNSDMWRGIEDEPRAIEAYEQQKGVEVESCGFMVRDDWGFPIGLSPDGLVGSDGLIECKSRLAKKQVQTILADNVPPENVAQLQCALLVSGREWIDYVSYCGGMPLYVCRVVLLPRYADAISAAVEQFERTAAEMVAAYTQATDGLPLTERVNLEIAV